jgi:PAS domain S-box-containing protein
MSRNEAEREKSEERERLLQQFQRHPGQSADSIDRLEKRLHESEMDQQLLDALLEYFPGGIAIAAAGDDKIRMVSKYSQQLLGWPREALEGLPLQEYVQKWDVLHLDGVTPATVEELPLVRATRQGQVVTDQEWLIRCRDGRTIRVLCNAGPIRNRRGDIIGGVVASLDITERQRAEEALAHLAAIVESSEDAIISQTLDGAILTWNLAAERLYGYSAEEIKGQSISPLVPTDRSGELRYVLKKIQQGERIASFETVRVRKDGSRVEVSMSIAPIRDATGRIIAAAKIDRDITERKRAEAALRHSREQFREVATLLPAAVYLCDASGLIKWYNARAVELWGREPDSASTEERFCGSYKIYHPDGTFIPHWETPIAELLRTGIPVHDRELIVGRPDGSRITVLVNIAPIKNEQGEVIGAINCFEDITERKQAERKLRESEERYRRIVETAAEGIKILDRDGRITFINPRGASLLGCSVEEMLRCSLFDFVFPEDLAETGRKLTQLLQGGQEEGDFRLRRKDGSPLWVHDVASPIPGDQGGYSGALVMFTNITLRKEAEKRALQAERLAAIGQVVAGLAHESGNALQRSQACLRMLALQVEDRPEALDLVDRMQKAQDQLQYLFADVRDYAAPIHLELRTCDLSEIWREAWSQLDFARQGREITFREEIGVLDLHCYADRFRLVQVFRNLLDNALAACRDPVVLSVHCSAAVIVGQPAIQVAVHDNGPGIAAEERPKLFEPFYTTKAKGTGLGLPIIRRIIEAHRGEIAVGEGTGSGAEILITLPRGEP